MYSASRWMRKWVVVVFLLVRCISSATVPLSVTPSTNWYGDDGSWSAVSIRVGTPPQWVDVMVNTVSSETWVVGPGGCSGNTICTTARGAVFDLSQSSTYKDQGFFSLGVDNRLGGTGYARYGLDDLTFGSTGVTLSNAIIGSINTTEFFLGMFGLGIVPGNFKNVTSLAAISALVETKAVIPSHSYGYTAGAKYQQKGMPVSLTLGGYDANRMVPHNTTFSLNPSQNPQTSINSITVVSSGTSNNWTTPIQLLSTVDRVSAIIDSSTPYLWFPQSVCDRFAQALGLTYNNSLGLYTFDGNPSQRGVLGGSGLSFTFTLSDLSSSPKTVNITVPYAAFDQQLSFPAIPNTTYGSTESTKYYFPLKRAATEGQYTIGRSFLQEAYLITDYERNTFSVHQAVHTSDPISNISLVSISRSSDTTLSGPITKKKSRGISTGAIVGIAIGATGVVALLTLLLFLFRRRSHRKEPIADEKSIETKEPRSFFARFRRQPEPPSANEAIGSTNYATEVGADASHERFELPAPLGPAELDSEAGTLAGTTENGSMTTDSNNLSAYERARRKLEQQQAAASHEHPLHETYPVEKTENDFSPNGHYRPPTSDTLDTPLISPVDGSHISINSQPSPVSPAFRIGPTIPANPISPPPTYRRISPDNVVYAGRLPDNVQLPRVVPQLIGSDGRTPPAEHTLITEAGTASTEGTSTLGSQYTENESTSPAGTDIYGTSSQRGVPHSPVSSRSGSGSGIGTGPVSVSDMTGSVSAVSATSSHPPISMRGGFGDNVIREEDESKFLAADMQALRADMQAREIMDPYAGRKRVHGDDMVHVPVPAERRFSWEEDRISGTDESGTR
ncbi:aspartic peptidase domain-containing protein [Tricladium varicosporioides]|nr:aspartic peptidase domain-containing protein [Hymenoscyphus varicosporioides]